jgi:hypothetical protein
MRLVSHQVPLADYEHALQLVERREGVKVILRPQ